MIKNAILYSIEMPNAHAMLGHINQVDGDDTNKFIARKPHSNEIATIGFCKHPIIGETVSKFTGGYCLTVLKWEKKINVSAVNARVKEMTLSIEEREQRTLKKKETDAVKDQIIGELLPDILPTPKYTFVYFHDKSNTLIVEATDDKTSDECTGLLRKTIGSLKATTLYVDSRIGLTTQIAEKVGSGDKNLISTRKPLDQIEVVTIGESLELKGGDTSSDLKFKNVDLFDDTTTAEIVGQITEGGMYVKSVELCYSLNAVTFNLVDGSKFKNFIFDGFLATGESNIDDWLSESMYCIKLVADISKCIVDHFTVVEQE